MRTKFLGIPWLVWGSLVLMVGIIFIVRRRTLLGEFHESDFKLWLNDLNEGVCYLNKEGKVLYYNQAALAHWHINEPSQLHALTLQVPVARALAGEHVTH